MLKAIKFRIEEIEVAALATGEGEVIPEGIVLSPGSVRLLHPLVDQSVYRHGWHSWSFTSWLEGKTFGFPSIPKEIWPMVDHPSCFETSLIHSSGLTAVGDMEGKCLLFGALGPGGWIEVRDGYLEGDYDSVPAPWLLAYGETSEVFHRYARILQHHLAIPQLGEKQTPRVWCSWYSFLRNIDEGLLLRVVESLRGLPIDVVQIDDGWEANIGDWEPNERFPRSLRFLAEAISQAGFIPGIWVAPFIARSNSEIVRIHPDWVLRDEGGEPVIAGVNWGGPFYALDVSNEAVLNWLELLLGRLRSWGFSYLKLDFLYGGALPGQCSSPEVCYRIALGRLRHAWGDGYLLTCGAPVMASLGLCDGLRIGPDSSPFWSNNSGHFTAPGARNAIATSSSRLWLKPLVHTDPDVVFFRSRYNLLSDKQRQLLLDLAAVAGFKATSDPPEWLDAQELHALQEFFSHPESVNQRGFYRFEINGRVVDFRSISQNK